MKEPTVRAGIDLYYTPSMLVDRDCVLLDGSCKCHKPYRDCKNMTKPPQKKDLDFLQETG